MHVKGVTIYAIEITPDYAVGKKLAKTRVNSKNNFLVIVCTRSHPIKMPHDCATCRKLKFQTAKFLKALPPCRGSR